MNPLVSARDLSVELEGERPPVVLDVRFQLGRPDWGREQFDAGHIAGARFVDVDTDLAVHPREDRAGGRHPLPSREVFAATLRRLGLSTDSSVVVLDQASSLSAARAWWMLRDAGIANVRVLDGGLAAWDAEGLPLTSEPTPEPEAGDLAVNPPILPVVDADGVAALLDAGGTVFDVRAPERFRGDVEPIDPVAGHIPGATNLPASTLQDSAGHYRPAAELRELVAGVQPGDAVSCGSGITACQALLAFEAAGLSGVQLYAGSWSDWISDPTRPIARG